MYSYDEPILPTHFWSEWHPQSCWFWINRFCEHSEIKEGNAVFLLSFLHIYPQKLCDCYLASDLKVTKLWCWCIFIFWRMYKSSLLGLLSQPIFLIWPHCSAVCVTAFPANPYTCLKPRKHDGTLTSFVVNVWEVTGFAFVRTCRVDGVEGIENLVMIRL